MAMVNRYSLYGFSVKSSFPLQAPRIFDLRKNDIEITSRGNGLFSKLTKPQFPAAQNCCYHSFDDGSDYVRFFCLFEFWIASNGKKIIYRPLKKTQAIKDQSFFKSSMAYLQANVLSFALLKFGLEPLHASAVVIDGQAIGLLGDSGAGKSTLVASFLSKGYPLLTDDLLLIRRRGESLRAFPGTPQIKLFSDSAKKFLGESYSGFPMNPDTKKIIISLEEKNVYRKAVPLGALYVLQPRSRTAASKKIVIRKMEGSKAAVEIARAAYNLAVRTSERTKQHFFSAADIVKRIPVRAISYPWEIRKITKLRDSILSDFESPAIFS